jgi:hypothetical protein
MALLRLLCLALQRLETILFDARALLVGERLRRRRRRRRPLVDHGRASRTARARRRSGRRPEERVEQGLGVGRIVKQAKLVVVIIIVVVVRFGVFVGAD